MSAGGKFGLTKGQVVQELGWDEDVDDELRIGVEDAIDGELIEEAMDAVDVVLLWWRDDDGDLVDGLVDAVVDLSASGVLWLLAQGRPQRLRGQRRHLRSRGHRRAGPDHLRERVPRLGGPQAGPAARFAAVSEPAGRRVSVGGRLRTSAPATSTGRRSRGPTSSARRQSWSSTLGVQLICTGELRGSATVGRFDELGVRVVAISCDAMFTLRAYADAEGLASTC